MVGQGPQGSACMVASSVQELLHAADAAQLSRGIITWRIKRVHGLIIIQTSALDVRLLRKLYSYKYHDLLVYDP